MIISLGVRISSESTSFGCVKSVRIIDPASIAPRICKGSAIGTDTKFFGSLILTLCLELDLIPAQVHRLTKSIRTVLRLLIPFYAFCENRLRIGA